MRNQIVQSVYSFGRIACAFAISRTSEWNVYSPIIVRNASNAIYLHILAHQHDDRNVEGETEKSVQRQHDRGAGVTPRFHHVISVAGGHRNVGVRQVVAQTAGDDVEQVGGIVERDDTGCRRCIAEMLALLVEGVDETGRDAVGRNAAGRAAARAAAGAVFNPTGGHCATDNDDDGSAGIADDEQCQCVCVYAHYLGEYRKVIQPANAICVANTWTLNDSELAANWIAHSQTF